MSQPLWQPSLQRVADAHLTAFFEQVESDWAVRCDSYSSLYEWSCREIGKFWTSVWRFGGVIGDMGDSTPLADPEQMPGARFFPDARLNYAENLLRRRGDADAIVFWGEGRIRRRLSFDELHDRVSRLAQAFQAMGVGEGDRVAAFMPNLPETVIALLAASSVGAIFSSCSPDFGVEGVVDRFGQIEPKVLVCADGYYFKEKSFPLLGRIAEITARLPTLEHVLVAGYLNDEPDLRALGGSGGGAGTGTSGGLVRPLQASRLDEVLAAQPGGEIAYRRLPFNHPIYILYSSGTTGKPKCIVHSTGGVLLKHLCELGLLCDVKRDDRVFYFTTCGWMMWNWLVSALACEATLLLFDGNPFSPRRRVLFDLAEAERMTLFGTSAKYIDAIKNAGLDPARTHDLSPLRTITSTGSPLAPEGFDYVYGHIKEDLCLSSISGGTDLVGCFVCGNPIGPVWRGEIQARALGMAVDVLDGEGRSLRGEKGELVCTAPFPSMPVYFWNDPDGARYRAAYFERYPGIWWHGDFAELTEHDGVIIYGRSDATLNPAGVRIGTAEIYRQVEKLDEVDEGIVIGQEWKGDVRIVLFVKLKGDLELTADLIHRIKAAVRSGCSPRHVPARVLQVADIPRTKSGKIVELAVREVVHRRPVRNLEALANPEALDLFADREELET
jgi:acetoacetyl-CoA synthetase